MLRKISQMMSLTGRKGMSLLKWTLLKSRPFLPQLQWIFRLHFPLLKPLSLLNMLTMLNLLLRHLQLHLLKQPVTL